MRGTRISGLLNFLRREAKDGDNNIVNDSTEMSQPDESVEERPRKKQRLESTEPQPSNTIESNNNTSDIHATLEAKKKALLQQLQASETTSNDVDQNNTNIYSAQDSAMAVEGSEYYYNTSEPAFVYREFNWSNQPDQIAKISDVYAKPRNNFLKGVKWAPDGTCLLANSEDNILRVYDIPLEEDLNNKHLPVATKPSLICSEGEPIYDFAWNPFMDSLKPETCFFVSTSKDHPVHLWDAFTGEMKATYRAFDSADEITAAFSVRVNPEGNKIYAGFNKMIRVFDINSPGRGCSQYNLVLKDSAEHSLHGIVSTMAFNNQFGENAVIALGTYTGRIGLYSTERMEPIYVLEGQLNGITHIQFTLDGTYLISGGRKDNRILCWDMRNLNNPVYQLNRTCRTNQRVYFDIDPISRNIITASQDGQVYAYNVSSGLLAGSFAVTKDVVNGVSMHPSLPYLAVSTGQRKFYVNENESSDESDEDSTRQHLDPILLATKKEMRVVGVDGEAVFKFDSKCSHLKLGVYGVRAKETVCLGDSNLEGGCNEVMQWTLVVTIVTHLFSSEDTYSLDSTRDFLHE